MIVDRLVALLKRTLPAPVWRMIRGLTTAIVTPFAFSIRTGHWRTALTGKIVDRRGNPIPWYSYPMIDFLSQRDFRGARVLEFGGGYSTLWWLRRGAEVVTIDHNADWADWVRSRTYGKPAEVHYMPFDIATRDMTAVAEFLSGKGQTFDIVVIDGHLREEAALLASDWLAPDGAMIIDNFDSLDFDFSAILARPRCQVVEFTGPGADGFQPWITALLFFGPCRLLAAADCAYRSPALDNAA